MTKHKDPTAVGSMLFSRNVSGVRVVLGNEKKSVAGITFEGFGAHSDNYPFSPYLTAAAAIGMTKNEVDRFIERLNKVLKGKPSSSKDYSSGSPSLVSPASTVSPSPSLSLVSSLTSLSESVSASLNLNSPSLTLDKDVSPTSPSDM